MRKTLTVWQMLIVQPRDTHPASSLLAC